ncbi:MAG: hypothetical protein ABIQ40_12630 [Bacteroidia bacterium]
MKFNSTYCKGGLSKWLLTVVLFFSSLSFSGYTENPLAHGQEKTQAVPALAAKPNFHKRCITFKRAIAFTYREKIFANTIENKKKALTEKRRLIKIELDDNLRRSFSFIIIEHAVHLETIPQNSGDDLFSSLAG